MEFVFVPLLTVCAVCLPLAAVFKGLRHPIYGLHMLVVVGSMLWLNHHMLAQVDAFAEPLWLPLACVHVVSINIITYLAYYMDKRASRRGAWRIPERTLHHLALIGGSPAALIAQRQLRHKTSKTSFKRTFWAIGALQILMIAALILN